MFDCQPDAFCIRFHSFTDVDQNADGQGQTAERILIHADSRSTNLVDQKMLYVALSRARAEAVVVTDDKDRLVRAIYERAGEKQAAMTASTPEAGKSKAMGAGLG